MRWQDPGQITDVAGLYRVREIIEKYEHRSLVPDLESGSSYRDEHGARHFVCVSSSLSLELHDDIDSEASLPCAAAEDTFWFGLIALHQLMVFCSPLISVLRMRRMDEPTGTTQRMGLKWTAGGLVTDPAASLHLQRWYTAPFGTEDRTATLARLQAATELERYYAAFRARTMIRELADI